MEMKMSTPITRMSGLLEKSYSRAEIWTCVKRLTERIDRLKAGGSQERADEVLLDVLMLLEALRDYLANDEEFDRQVNPALEAFIAQALHVEKLATN